MNEYAKSRIDKLQNNLEAIRKAGGWTAEEFGDMIGTTKQTIRNLETGETTMTQTQYIAIRTVLDFEAQDNPDNVLLNNLVKYLLDYEDDNQEKEQNIASTMAYISGTKKGSKNKSKIDQKVVLKTAAAILGISAGVLLAGKFGGKSTGSWLKKLLPKG